MKVVGTKAQVQSAIDALDVDHTLPIAGLPCPGCGAIEVVKHGAPDGGLVKCKQCNRSDVAGVRAATLHVAKAYQRKDGKWELGARWAAEAATAAKAKPKPSQTATDAAMSALDLAEPEAVTLP